MFMFLTVVQALIATALVGVILIQKSEGGGLGTGGSPSGFMSARGAADFLTRTTQVLAGLFVAFSIVLAAMAVKTGAAQQTIDTSLNRSIPAASTNQQPGSGPAPAPALGQPPVPGLPGGTPAGGASPASTTPAGSFDPLAGALKK